MPDVQRNRSHPECRATEVGDAARKHLPLRRSCAPLVAWMVPYIRTSDSMTAASDLHAQALTAIAERLAKVGAGTPGRWSTRTVISRGDWSGAGAGSVHRVEPDVGIQGTEIDAALIVAAVNDFEPLLRLAEMVLTVHRPVAATFVKNPDWCHGCAAASWPCHHALAALTALGVHDG